MTSFQVSIYSPCCLHERVSSQPQSLADAWFRLNPRHYHTRGRVFATSRDRSKPGAEALATYAVTPFHHRRFYATFVPSGSFAFYSSFQYRMFQSSCVVFDMSKTLEHPEFDARTKFSLHTWFFQALVICPVKFSEP